MTSRWESLAAEAEMSLVVAGGGLGSEGPGEIAEDAALQRQGGRRESQVLKKQKGRSDQHVRKEEPRSHVASLPSMTELEQLKHGH